MADKTSLIVTGLSGMIGDRFQELYGHKFSFDNLDLTTSVDITKQKQVFGAVAKSSADFIIHLAAFTDVDEAHKQNGDKKGSAYQVNVVGTQNVVDAAKEYNKYLIFVSTDFVFSGTKNNPYTEDDQPNPIEWYGNTKAQAEQIITKELENYSILRVSYPYRSKFKPKQDIIRKIIKGLQNDNLSAMFTDNFVTPTFIDDLCKVFFMFTLKRPRGIYHATGSSSLSSYDLALLVKETFELKGNIPKGTLEAFMRKSKRPYQKSLIMSNNKLQEELGNPMLAVESALQIVKTQL